MEDKIRNEIDSLKVSNETYRSVSPLKTTAPSFGMNPQEIKQMEDKMNKIMAESVEQLGSLIKDYSRKLRKHNDRLGDLEVKMFG